MCIRRSFYHNNILKQHHINGKLFQKYPTRSTILQLLQNWQSPEITEMNNICSWIKRETHKNAIDFEELFFFHSKSPSCKCKVTTILLKMPMGKWQIELWQKMENFSNNQRNKENPTIISKILFKNPQCLKLWF